MTSWHIDIAFDTNASTAGKQLQWGVVTTTGTPGYLSDFKENDTLKFFIYNITAGASGLSSQPTLTAFSCTSTDGLASNGHSSPFTSNPFNAVNPVFQNATGGRSTPFGFGIPYWVVASGNGTYLQATVNTSGQYVMTFEMDINGQNWSVDPVMIVTSG